MTMATPSAAEPLIAAGSQVEAQNAEALPNREEMVVESPHFSVATRRNEATPSPARLRSTLEAADG